MLDSIYHMALKSIFIFALLACTILYAKYGFADSMENCVS